MMTNRDYVSSAMPPVDSQLVEEMYLAFRIKEGRTYTDEQTRLLPYIAKGHPNEKEWKIRRQSSDRLINFLKKQQRFLNILEVGSGNGWLAARLAKLPDVKVTALEPGRIETEQAQRVFKKDNLNFIRSPFSSELFKGQPKFDVIIFAASVQYFPVFKEVMEEAFTLLASDGCVHIIDTNFYKKDEVQMARERCLEYYDVLGFPLMGANYSHHLLEEVNHFRYKILFNPHTFWNKLTRQQGFYWLILTP